MNDESDSMQGSVTDWIANIHQPRALRRLWDRYFSRLVKLASTQAADDEAVASAVLTDLWVGFQDGRFSQLTNRDELWRLLVCLTRANAVDEHRYRSCQRRGGNIAHEPLTPTIDYDEQLFSSGPTPGEMAQLRDELDHLLSLLEDSTLSRIVVLRMSGLPNEAIGRVLSISAMSVGRKLLQAQQIWSGESDASDNR